MNFSNFAPAVLAAALLAMTVVPPLATAQSGPSTRHDSTLPIEITADALEVQQNQQTATFSGNVDAVQGKIRLRAEILKVHYRQQQDSDAVEGAISRIDASGKVFFSAPGQTAKGDTGIYDVDNSLVTLDGNVVLTRDKSVIRGSRVVLNLKTGKSRVESAGGSSGKGRVRGLFVPR